MYFLNFLGGLNATVKHYGQTCQMAQTGNAVRLIFRLVPCSRL